MSVPVPWIHPSCELKWKARHLDSERVSGAIFLEIPRALLYPPAPHLSDGMSLCTHLQKGSPFRFYHGSGHYHPITRTTATSPSGPTISSVSVLHPSSPCLPEWSPHNTALHLSHFSAQKHPSVAEAPAARLGVRDSAQSTLPNPTLVFPPPGPTRTRALVRGWIAFSSVHSRSHP